MNNLKEIFKNITLYLQERFLSGVYNLTIDKIEKIEEYKNRLHELHAFTLETLLDTLISYIKEESYENIIEQMLNIFTYIRVFDRLNTKNTVLKMIKNE